MAVDFRLCHVFHPEELEENTVFVWPVRMRVGSKSNWYIISGKQHPSGF